MPLRTSTLAAVVAATLAAAIAAHHAPALAQEAGPRRSRAVEAAVDLGKLFDSVEARVATRFFDSAKLASVGWPEQAKAAREKVVASATVAEAAGHINALLGELKTSHTAFYTPDDIEYAILLDAIPGGEGLSAIIRDKFWGSGPSVAGIGAFTARHGDRHFIDGVLQGSPAASAGLKVGDEIADVDDAPYHPVRSFRGKSGQVARIAVRRAAEAAVESVEVPVVTMLPGAAFTAATLDSPRVIERGGKRIGYMQVWASKDSSAFRNALARLSPGGVLAAGGNERGRSGFTVTTSSETVTTEPLDAIIVDMRGKIGGSSGTIREYLEMLGAFEPAHRFAFKGRGNDQRRDQAKRNPPFKGRAVLLIDHHTRSAAEMFAYAFKREGMGPLIGTTTAGAVSAAATFAMPGGNLLYLAVSGIEADGVVLEGKGVAPDIMVERPLPYAGGADPVLEAGIAYLASR